MTDYTELKRLAEAFPADLDWDSNTEPFFNGPSGESLGGGSTGFYCVYGAPFEIDGEQYDGHTYVETCKADFAKFMVAARDGVLALIAENEALRKDAERYRWLKSRPVNTPTHGPDLAQWDDHQGDALRGLFADEAIDAAMGKGEQS